MVELRNVVRKYSMGKTEVEALRGLSLEIKEGEFVAIVGPSGSGKSTLMHLIGALDVPNEGEVLLDGRDISEYEENDLAGIRGEKVGFVFQTFNLIPTLNALENVSLPLTFQGVRRDERDQRARHLLEMVGLGDRTEHKPAELSGGEQQRVAIARALVNDPEILLADEPTGNLDSETGEEVMKLLEELNRDRGMTVVIVTHNLSDAEHAERTIHMVDGKLGKNGSGGEG